MDYFPFLLVLKPKPTKHKQQRGNFNLPNLNRFKAETFPGPHLSGSLVKREWSRGGVTKQERQAGSCPQALVSLAVVTMESTPIGESCATYKGLSLVLRDKKQDEHWTVSLIVRFLPSS